MTGKELLPLIHAKGRGDRMSENLYKWVRKYQVWEIGAAFTQLSLMDGSTVFYDRSECQAANIIITTGAPDHFTSGSRLSTILGEGARAEKYAFITRSFNVIPIDEWWQEYIDGGKCFIDPQHKLYQDDERWEVSDSGEVRRCLWCGNHQQEKHIQMIPRVIWDSVTDLVMRGEGR